LNLEALEHLFFDVFDVSKLVHAWIRGIHPMLWRRFLVRSDSTLADLHVVLQIGTWGCKPKPSKIPSKWISDFHSLVQLSFADIGSIFTATIPFVAEELRSISMRCWQTWHCQKATKGSLKPSNYGFDPIRPRNVMANCLPEFSRVWAYNPMRNSRRA
jgi:hypothetical protein